MEDKNNSSFMIKIILFLSIALIVAIIIYSEVDRRNIKESQNMYQAMITDIQKQLNDGNCDQASLDYSQAKVARDEIMKSGLYYSLESHAKQAHAIEIAECFAQKEEFSEAVRIIEMEEVHDPDYLFKAAKVYESAGDIAKAETARAMAEKYE